MDAFEPPSGGVDDAADPDPADAVPSMLVRIAGVAFALASAFVAGSGVQLWAFFFMTWWIKGLATLMIVSGCSSVLCGAYLMQARSWAAFLALALACFQALLSVVWCLYALSGGLLSVMMIFAAIFSVLAVPLVGLAIPGAMKATAAKKALYS